MANVRESATVVPAPPVQAEKVFGARFWDNNPCGGEWPNYGEFLEFMRRTEPFQYRMLDQHDWMGKHVLDVGCGQGTLLNELPPRGAAVCGVDMSRTSLLRAYHGACALGQNEQVCVCQADAESLPFTDASFDAVISIGVLHHTPRTRVAIHEVWRVLRPGGLALVMLYRTGNPKWWAANAIRNVSRLADRVSGRDRTIAGWLGKRQQVGSVKGTALLELFGCPTLQAFSNREARAMFAPFAEVSIANHAPGFYRLVDIAAVLAPLRSFLRWIDRRFERSWGFYQVIEARK